MSSTITDGVSPTEFTTALALAANGVAIVTTDGDAGKAGLTVSSICSVCAEPALMLACVHAQNEFCSIAQANGVFAINLLTRDQSPLSNIFAGISEDKEANRFAHGQWNTLHTGAPVLSNALVTLDCTMQSHETQGTHIIYIGKVVAVHSHDSQALVYCQRAYGSVTTD
jgi:flavin reductase